MGSDTGAGRSSPVEHRLGLRENWWQFSLYMAITLLVGMTIGVERVALPPLARESFGITSVFSTVSFLSAFGAVKAAMNLVSGHLSDRRGRKGILLAGWAFALPYALLIIFATAWWQVIVANLFLGVNQALTWTMSVTAKIDLVGPANRGLAVGLDESAGYVGTGLGGMPRRTVSSWTTNSTGISSSCSSSNRYPHCTPLCAAVMMLPTSVSASMTTSPGPMTARNIFQPGNTARVGGAARLRAVDSIELHLSHVRAAGQPVPYPDRHPRGRITAELGRYK